ncbi:RING-H2 finger protein ATL72-like [Impatiens glandulifera]|uniref:RING-H2 finger protein ATL72-like n=1 Tax=Impatiens glandulifera TaxID=253017 RepID=UPI001FB06EDE|nr:RING-H2 finger protein ATL72-like [Impatiens glandulifera]
MEERHVAYFGRHLLLDNNNIAATLPPANGTNPPANTNNSDFENNMVVILAGLLCALICVLGLNSMLRCVFRCCQRFRVERPPDQESGQLGSSSSAAGLKKEALNQIPVEVYSVEVGIPMTGECPICLGEFTEGEKVRILPECRHGFHAKCIDKWLSSSSSCPTCRAALA